MVVVERTVLGQSTNYSNSQGGMIQTLVEEVGRQVNPHDDFPQPEGGIGTVVRSNPRNNSNPVTEAKMLVWTDRRQAHEYRGSGCVTDDLGPTVSRREGTGGGNVPMVGLRRLTPREQERRQGFPDDWTRWGIDEDGNEIEISDSARYRLVGNAVPVPVVEWIARRLAAVAERAAETAEEQKVVAAKASTG